VNVDTLKIVVFVPELENTALPSVPDGLRATEYVVPVDGVFVTKYETYTKFPVFVRGWMVRIGR
jgi:hypothetical protein